MARRTPEPTSPAPTRTRTRAPARAKAAVPSDDAPLDLGLVDLAQLAFFVGHAVNGQVQAGLAAKGFDDVRTSHAFVIQHLVASDRSVGELSQRLGVSQQAASKAIAELEALGYVARASAEDKRVSRVGLTARGRDVVRTQRQLRLAIDKKLTKAHGERATAQAKKLMIGLLESLGAADAIRERRVRPPR